MVATVRAAQDRVLHQPSLYRVEADVVQPSLAGRNAFVPDSRDGRIDSPLAAHDRSGLRYQAGRVRIDLPTAQLADPIVARHLFPALPLFDAKSPEIAAAARSFAATTGNSVGNFSTAGLDKVTSQIDVLQNKMNTQGLSDTEIFQLQNLAQQRLQLFSLLSNLLKSQHESLMAIVNNIRG